jgi:hypothetical protein
MAHSAAEAAATETAASSSTETATAAAAKTSASAIGRSQQEKRNTQSRKCHFSSHPGVSQFAVLF